MNSVDLSSLKLESVPGVYAIYRVGRQTPLQDLDWRALWQSPFLSVTTTPDEVSVVVAEEAGRELAERAEQSEAGFVAFRVAGTLAFELTGILHRLTAPLAEEDVSVFAVSTFDTDYLLVKQERADDAKAAFRARGCLVDEE